MRTSGEIEAAKNALKFGKDLARKWLEEFTISGSRMHAAYFRPGGVHQDLPDGMLDSMDGWIKQFMPFLKDIEKLLKRTLPAEVVPGFVPDPTIKAEPIVLGRGGGGGQRSSQGRRPAGSGGRAQSDQCYQCH